MDISDHNHAKYHASGRVREYKDASALKAEEALILAQLRSEFAGARILDIGVGGGRTTPHLLEISKNYIGVDYSAPMVAQCKARYPSVSFEVCDARDLSRFGPEAFDLIFFSFNGIDSIGHADRLKALREIYRALAKSGAFVFSSHNRNFAGRQSPLSLTKHPAFFLKTLLRDPYAILFHTINRRHEQENDEYAIVNDEASSYRMLHYYISIEKQIKQLNDRGRLSPQEYRGYRDSPWLYYVCRHQRGRAAQGAGVSDSSLVFHSALRSPVALG
jgi:SAM-dependent methyltransferase